MNTFIIANNEGFLCMLRLPSLSSSFTLFIHPSILIRFHSSIQNIIHKISTRWFRFIVTISSACMRKIWYMCACIFLVLLSSLLFVLIEYYIVILHNRIFVLSMRAILFEMIFLYVQFSLFCSHCAVYLCDHDDFHSM